MDKYDISKRIDGQFAVWQNVNTFNHQSKVKKGKEPVKIITHWRVWIWHLINVFDTRMKAVNFIKEQANG